MSKTPESEHDWTRADAMTEEEIHAAALSDPDAQPFTPENVKRMKQTPRVTLIRRVLGLSQEEFAARFHIPLGTLRDWEQGRKAPDAAARAYLAVIGRNSEAVREALTPSRAGSRSWNEPEIKERHSGKFVAKRRIYPE